MYCIEKINCMCSKMAYRVHQKKLLKDMCDQNKKSPTFCPIGQKMLILHFPLKKVTKPCQGVS